MPRLSPQDASFLYVENDLNHMSIAALAVFEGPPPGREAVDAMVAAKLELVPRYRQRVRFVPFDLGRPVWCDDPHFSLRYHVRHTALPAPGGAEQLQALVGRVMSQQLDRRRPLWELWAIEGLDAAAFGAPGAEEPGGAPRWAMLMKLHHCMADGVAATDLLSALMDTAPTTHYAPPAPWSPQPDPSPAQLLREALAERATSPREIARTVRDAVDAPLRAAKKAGELLEGLGTFRSFANRRVESSLNGPIGPHRTWRWAATTLAEIKKIRSAHGGTVNDVVLAAITRGFRDLLLSRGEPVEGLVVRSLVPVSVRREDEHDEPGNRVSAMFAELPVGMVDPVGRLHAIRRQMDDLKAHHQAQAGETLMALQGLAPPLMVAAASRLFASLPQDAVQTVTTNVPGPRQTLYAAGRAVTDAFLYVPLGGSVRIGVAMFSYAGKLTFAVTSDMDSAPDTDVLCRGIESAIEELLGVS